MNLNRAAKLLDEEYSGESGNYFVFIDTAPGHTENRTEIAPGVTIADTDGVPETLYVEIETNKIPEETTISDEAQDVKESMEALGLRAGIKENVFGESEIWHVIGVLSE